MGPPRAPQGPGTRDPPGLPRNPPGLPRDQGPGTRDQGPPRAPHGPPRGTPSWIPRFGSLLGCPPPPPLPPCSSGVRLPFGGCLPFGCPPTFRVLAYLSGVCLSFGCLPTFRVSAYLSGVCLSFGCLPTFRVERMMGLNPPKSQGVDGLGSQEGRLSKNRGSFFFPFFLGWSSCGLLGGSRWFWEALEAIFVERILGLNPPKSQGVDGWGSKEGRLSKTRGPKKSFFFFLGGSSCAPPPRIFEFGPLDPLGGPESPSGPTLERTIFYDFLNISLILRFSSIFHS